MEDKKLKGIAKLRYILFLLKPYWKYGKTYMIVTIALAAIVQPIATFLSALLPKQAIDSVMAGAPRKDILLTIGLYTLGIALATAVQKVVSLAYTQLAQTRIGNKIRNDVNEKALFTDFKYYDNPEFYTKFIFAQEQYPNQSHMAMMLFPKALQGIVTMGAMTGLIVSTASPALLGVALFFLLLSGAAALPTLKPEADFHVKMTEVWRPFDYVSRMLKQKENAAELRSSGAGLKFLNTFNVVMQQFQSVFLGYRRKVMPFHIAQGIIEPIQVSSILAYIIFFVIDGDTSKIGLYASLTAASAALIANISTAFTSINDILQRTLYGERIAAFFEAVSEIEPAHEGTAPPPDGVYEVELRDVSFGYDKTTFCINHMNLHIKPGQRIAIVGENGAGKTTLTKFLLRLYDVTDGQVLINGIDIKDYDIHALRLRIGVAFQDVRILAMSLRDNLTVYHDVSDDQLMEVIHKLGLESVVEKINEDDPLGKMVSREFTAHGVVLSGGEAQRVSLARLFTGPFGLLVLDEPSSALDPLAEYKLMQTILDASNTSTTIMIAHRLSTVRDFDMIYHMENGKIIESGTHDELVATQGKYYEMFTRQAENYQNNE